MFSLLAVLFDLLGIVSPMIGSKKILFQEINSGKIQWDEVFKGGMKGRWDKWLENLLRTKTSH